MSAASAGSLKSVATRMFVSVIMTVHPLSGSRWLCGQSPRNRSRERDVPGHSAHQQSIDDGLTVRSHHDQVGGPHAAESRMIHAVLPLDPVQATSVAYLGRAGDVGYQRKSEQGR